MEAALVNAIGLICDVIGAIMIWKFTLPHRKRTIMDSPSWDVVVDQDPFEEGDPEYVAMNNSALQDACWDAWSQFGIISLITGFALQAISGWL